MNRILVIRGGAIGDFILTLPAIKLLRDNYPESHLEILGYKHITALAENRFYANATRSIEYAALARFFSRAAELSPDLANYFSGFDLIVSYLFDPDEIFATNLRRCGEFELIAGPAKPDDHEHAALQLARPLTAIGLTLADRAAKVYPSSADRAAGQGFSSTLSEPLIAIHPGSGSDAKNWPPDRWQALAENILVRFPTATLIVFGGEADRPALGVLRRILLSDRVKFAQDLPLTTVAAIAERCALYIGHDSGISHIAAAVETPALLLFGPTDPRVWAPANRNVRILRSATKQMNDLSLDEVEHVAHLLLRTSALSS